MDNWIQNLTPFFVEEKGAEELDEVVDVDAEFEKHGILVYNKSLKNVVEIEFVAQNMKEEEFDKQLFTFVCCCALNSLMTETGSNGRVETLKTESKYDRVALYFTSSRKTRIQTSSW